MADRPPPLAGQPDELSPVDYLLHRGEAHPATRSAFMDLEILDQPADWPAREAMDRASRVVIRMRQKVVIPPVPTTPPRWVVDPDFDLDYHLRRVALPAPARFVSSWTWPRSRCSRRLTPRARCGRRCTSRGWPGMGPGMSRANGPRC